MYAYTDKKLYGQGYKVLTEEEMDRIQDSSLEILREVGVYMGSKDAQDYMDSVGCIVDRETGIVKIPSNVVLDALDSIPKLPEGMTIPIFGRDGQVLIPEYGANEVNLSCSGVCTNYLDPFTGERRLPTFKDVCDTAKICDAVPEIINYQIAVSAEDVPKPLMVLFQHAAIVENFTKLISKMNQDTWVFEKQLDIVEACAGGPEQLREKPFFGYGLDPISPLAFDTAELDMTIQSIKRTGVAPCVFTDMMAGATGPATLAGALVVTTAECLAGLVFTQAIEKGCVPSIGTSSSFFDMKNMISPIGAAEHALFTVATGQFAQRWGVGCTAGGT